MKLNSRFLSALSALFAVTLWLVPSGAKANQAELDRQQKKEAEKRKAALVEHNYHKPRTLSKEETLKQERIEEARRQAALDLALKQAEEAEIEREMKLEGSGKPTQVEIENEQRRQAARREMLDVKPYRPRKPTKEEEQKQEELKKQARARALQEAREQADKYAAKQAVLKEEPRK